MGSAKQECDSLVPNTTETLKEEIMLVLLLPIICGVYSFLHWFILVPLLWTVIAPGSWNATSFLIYEVVAFAIWIVVIAILLNMKCCKKKEPPRSLKTCKNSSSHLAPHFQTRTAHVQPKDENLFHEPHLSQSGCDNKDRPVSISLYSIPVQPQSVSSPSSKKNLQASAELFSKSPPDPVDQKPQTVVLTIKENVKPNLRVSSLPVTESAGENLESKDKVYHSKDSECGDTTNLKDTVLPDNNYSENHEKRSHLSREESFVGLPEMNSFGSYLQLVTVDTPFSPSEQFFPDSAKKPDSDQAVKLNQSKEENTHESRTLQNDSPALEERDRRSKMKDIPDDRCRGGGGGDSNICSSGGNRSSDESGKGENKVETGKRNSEKLTKGGGVGGCGDDDDEVFAPGAPVPHSEPKETLGECFIADVRKTESLTSEVFITVNEPIHRRNTGDIIHVNLPSDALEHDVMNETSVCEEGKWAILK